MNPPLPRNTSIRQTIEVPSAVKLRPNMGVIFLPLVAEMPRQNRAMPLFVHDMAFMPDSPRRLMCR